MTKRKQSATPAPPLTIEIHGHGIDISATFDGRTALPDIIASMMSQRSSLPTPPHDFDVILRVLKHGDLPVLQAIADLANREIETRRAAS